MHRISVLNIYLYRDQSVSSIGQVLDFLISIFLAVNGNNLSYMKHDSIKIPANESEILLYCYIGEAIWKIQVVEQALSSSITLKTNPTATKEQADRVLSKFQSYTLGKAVNIASNKKLYDSSLQGELYAFLEQRNWLVHSAMAENCHDKNWENNKEELFSKIKAISNKLKIFST